MINTLCGSIHDPSSNSEYPTSSSKSPPNESSNSETKNILPSSQEETLEPKNTLTPPSLDFPPIKFELDEVPPDSLMWDTFFTDHFLDSSDFMISSPIRNNYMMSSSPPATTNITTTTVTTNSSLISYNNNINNIDNYSYNNSYQIQAMQCSPPRFSPSNHVGGFNSSSSNYLKPKGQSPLRRMFNSPNNNNNNNNFQYMQLSDCNSLASLQAALGDLLGDYSADHGFISSSPIKFPGTTENMSKQLLGDVSATNNNPAVLDCLQMENSSGFSGSSSDQGSSSSSTSLSQQLQKERHQEKQQQHNKFAHALMPPGPINTDQEQDSGLQLVHLLLACAEAVSKEEYMLARRYLYQLNRIVSPLGDSMQRVAACFTEALTARLAATLTTKPTTPSSSSSSTLKPLISPNIPPNPFEILKIYQIVYQACPYIKFAHFTANQAIFEAFEAEERVHIIDLDILQGYQWPAFMQALAARPNGAPFLRITGVGPCIEYIKETGRSLTQLAHSLHIPFEFHPVDEQLEDLRPHMLNRRVGEALAVNAVNRLHRVSGNSLGNLLTMIRDQAPNIVTLVEQEASHNGPYFLGRFLEALHYYSAIFDSLDATFPQDSAQRAKVEQYIFAPEIRNIVACEGVERIERHERLEKWRKIMEGKGYEGVPLSANAVTQSKILLGLYSCDGYRLTEEKGCLLLGWQDRAILAASSWR